VPTAEKRQRKKENARLAREARESAVKKRRRNRTIRNAAIAVAVFVVVILILTLVGSNNKKKPTVAVSPTTTPAAAGATCNDTKPVSSTKLQDQTGPTGKLDPKKTYTAVMSTSCGDITIALDVKNAPKGANNFVFLARQGFYDGLTFHRAVKGFVVQGGDPAGTGSGSPGYEVVTELPKDGYPLGTLAYAKTGSAPAGSAGSQFFIVTGNRPASLEQKQNGSYQYGVFGHITKGIEVAQKMESFAPASGDGPPTRPLYIFKVTITEK
jgi:cyclophilin family peptidyl-prolyl cis-trans isomerase